MCTLTYFPEQSGLDNSDPARWIFFNRDEQRTRSPAYAPVLLRGSDSDYLMPIDPDSGGSWMGLSGNGFFACLMNNYSHVPTPDCSEKDCCLRSRGLIIRDILNSGIFPDTMMLDDILHRHTYAPFFLAVFSVDKSKIWEWNGMNIRQSLSSKVRQAGILSSNSNTPEIPKRREVHFKNLSHYNVPSLRQFHRNRGRVPEAAVLMRRTDARTVSVSEICLKRKSGSIRYYGTPPFILGQKSSLKFAVSAV